MAKFNIKIEDGDTKIDITVPYTKRNLLDKLDAISELDDKLNKSEGD